MKGDRHMKLSKLLTRERLEDAAKCYTNWCSQCKLDKLANTHSCMEKVAQTALHYMDAAERYRDMLEKLILAIKGEHRGGKLIRHSILVEEKVREAKALLKGEG